ncbi:MAG: AAA-like domain-containing protein [Nostoc sp.]
MTLLKKEPELMSAMQQVIATDEKVELEAITAYKLESMGLVQLNGSDRLCCSDSLKSQAIAPSMKVDERAIASSSKCDRLSYSESQTIKAIALSIKVDQRAIALEKRRSDLSDR